MEEEARFNIVETKVDLFPNSGSPFTRKFFEVIVCFCGFSAAVSEMTRKNGLTENATNRRPSESVDPLTRHYGFASLLINGYV